MLKFHWMQRVTPYTLLLPDEIKNNNNIFEQIKYESVMYTYYEGMSNSLIKIANSIDKKQSFKYMFAIRPYTVSVDFLLSIYRAFEEISPGRFMLNLVVGNDINSILNYNEKLKYHRDFIEELRSKNNTILGIYVSGSSDYLIETGLKYADKVITEFANYDKFKKHLNNTIFLIPICVRDTFEEANNLGIKMGFEGVYGNMLDIDKRFKEIEAMGIKEIMLCPLDNDNQQHKIHEIISNIIK